MSATTNCLNGSLLTLIIHICAILLLGKQRRIDNSESESITANVWLFVCKIFNGASLIFGPLSKTDLQWGPHTSHLHTCTHSTDKYKITYETMSPVSYNNSNK